MRRRRRRRRIDASQKSAKDAKRARPLAIQISHQTWTDTKMVSEMRSQNYYTHLSLGQYNFFQKWNHNTPSMPIIEEFNIYSNYYRPHGIVKKKIEVLRPIFHEERLIFTSQRRLKKPKAGSKPPFICVLLANRSGREVKVFSE